MDIFASNYAFEFGDTYYPNGGKFGPMRHKHLELFVMLKGEAFISSDGENYHIKEGQTGLFYNNQSFEARYKKGETARSIWCGTGTIDFIITDNEIERLKALPCILPPSDLLLQLLRIGNKLDNSDDVNSRHKRNTLAETVFNEYFSLAEIERKEPLPRAILKAKQYIDENYTEPCDLKMIAEHVPMTTQHLSKIFKQQMGCTPIKYLWRRRSEKGINLLRHSGLTIYEITAQCGFKDPYHFSRYLKKNYGHSPREIRKNRWQPTPETMITREADH